MYKNNQVNNDELNIIQLIQIYWKGRFKVILILIISIIFLLIHQSIIKNNSSSFLASTEIRPISVSGANEYIVLKDLDSSYIEFVGKIKSVSHLDEENITNNLETNNNLDTNINTKFINISKTKLLEQYIEVLNQNTLFEEAILKYGLVDANEYPNEELFRERVIKLVSSIQINPPEANKLGVEKKRPSKFHTISFKYDDAEKWKAVLLYVDRMANKQVKKIFQNKFKLNLEIANRMRTNEIEDISVKIENLIKDYERKTSDRISFLEEQSSIAKKLGIAKNTIEVQTFGNQNALLSNVNTDSPFYLRGYESIDKEISLMSTRDNKKAFVEGLFEAELEQRRLLQDKTLERYELIFNSTPLSSDSNSFLAASLKVSATNLSYKAYDTKTNLTIAIVIGLIISIFYILISHAIQSEKISRKK